MMLNDGLLFTGRYRGGGGKKTKRAVNPPSCGTCSNPPGVVALLFPVHENQGRADLPHTCELEPQRENREKVICAKSGVSADSGKSA